MYRAFISHTSSDDAFVARLANRLESPSVAVWIDSGRILPGDDIIERIDRALSDATHIVVVFSPASLLSNWVREESHAAQLAAIAGRARIIPVIYGAMSPSAIPTLLRSRLFVDFRDPAQFDRSMSQLLSAFVEPSAQVEPSLEVVDLQIARRVGDDMVGLELLLRSGGNHAVSITRLSVESSVPYHVAYAFPPSTLAFPLKITLGPRTANGIAIVGGSIGHEADDWRRPVTGQLILAPYHTGFRVELPIYVALGPRENALLRIPIEEVTSQADSAEEINRFSRTGIEEEDFAFGTRVSIESSGQVIATYTSHTTLLGSLGPAIVKAQPRLARRLGGRLHLEPP